MWPQIIRVRKHPPKGWNHPDGFLINRQKGGKGDEASNYLVALNSPPSVTRRSINPHTQK